MHVVHTQTLRKLNTLLSFIRLLGIIEDKWTIVGVDGREIIFFIPWTEQCEGKN